jgi:hypothetical protein
MHPGHPAFGVTGHPALALMAGLSQSGLPLSVQFFGRYFAEETSFQVARADGPSRAPPSRLVPRFLVITAFEKAEVCCDCCEKARR